MTSSLRVFTPESYWNTPLPVDAPIDPGSADFIKQLASYDSSVTGPKLVVGTTWGMPIYWSTSKDKLYSIVNPQTNEKVSVHIPAAATPMTGGDGAMTIFDSTLRVTVGLWKAVYKNKTWSCSGWDAYYWDSNGLCSSLAQSNDSRNKGHRGYPSALAAVRSDELTAGTILHVLKVSLDQTAPAHVFPGCGHETGRGTMNDLPQGARLRVSPTINLVAKGLKGNALVIAQALQTYGMVVGDTGNTPMGLKLESTITGLSGTALKLFWNDLEVIQLGYGS